MFIGREQELQFLNDRYNENKGQLIVLYGRIRHSQVDFPLSSSKKIFLLENI